jgi:hypothetical protein
MAVKEAVLFLVKAVVVVAEQMRLAVLELGMVAEGVVLV